MPKNNTRADETGIIGKRILLIRDIAVIKNRIRIV